MHVTLVAACGCCVATKTKIQNQLRKACNQASHRVLDSCNVYLFHSYFHILLVLKGQQRSGGVIMSTATSVYFVAPPHPPVSPIIIIIIIIIIVLLTRTQVRSVTAASLL